ncbi:MAG: excinuclease ABC subunit UvrC [Bacteroidetes bacterium]|nr:excinuclease ABC subunit UvrC [Bacteroidota bacterium]
MFPISYLQSVPHSSGIYMMMNKSSKVLYIGKAKNLYKRLSSYSRISNESHSKTAVMLKQVEAVNTLITRTEKEALILEASLIKKHKPKYNIILRDDKNYPLIKVTMQEEWPRVMMTRRRKRDGSRYFGPYSSISSMWSTLKLISSLFPLRRCKGSSLKPRKRPCLNLQMGQCLAPCLGLTDHEPYMENVKKVIMILEGRSRDIVTQLKKQMQDESYNFEFEKAAVTRDRIYALKRTLEKQIIVSNHHLDQDIFGFYRNGAAVSIAILFLRNGSISGSRTFFLKDPFGDDPAILSQTLSQFYFEGANLPKEIILPFDMEDYNLLLDHFSELQGSKIHITIPQRGDKLHLITMARKNAEHVFDELEKKKKSWNSLSDTLSKRLNLTNIPNTIECLDISNISGKIPVGSLVHYYQGEPLTTGFRHYKIQSETGPDDYAMMAEVLQRRLEKGIHEDNLPDLFLVDGGRGQLSVALSIASKLNISEQVDWIGIAKEKEDEGEKLYKPGRKNPIRLPYHNPALLYLMRIRDEAHRFGVTFHRKLRNKSTLASELDKIPGIGPSRKKQLLKELGSLKRIKTASEEDLSRVSGIGPELAFIIYRHLRADSIRT